MSETRTVDGIEWTRHEDCWWADDGTTIEFNPQSLRGFPAEPLRNSWVMLGPELEGLSVALLGCFDSSEAAMRAYASTRPTARKEQE